MSETRRAVGKWLNDDCLGGFNAEDIARLCVEYDELERKVTEALGFSYAYCATWEAGGRRVGELEASKILDAWKKSGGMT